jgi:predicted ester cyclase
MNFYRLKDGRVTHVWAQSDALGMMQQLGAIPA